MHVDNVHGASGKPLSAGAWLRAGATRAARDLAYLAIGLVTSVVAFTVAVAGVTASLSTAVFVVGLPVILLSAVAFRWCAELDRRNAALVLGRRLHGRYRDLRGQRFLSRLSGTLRDAQTWRDLAWLVIHSVVGFSFGVVAVSAVAAVVGIALAPAWYWAVPDGLDWGIWRIDTLGEALLAAPLAIPLAAIAIALLRAMALGESRLAEALLDAREPIEPARAAARPARRRVDGRAALALDAALSALAGATVTVIWGLTGGSFWPRWVWLGLAIPLALHAGISLAVWRTTGHARALAVHGAVSAVLAGVIVAVWALAGGGAFWPTWALLGLAVALAGHAAIAELWERLPVRRERALAQRVDVLTRTRRGALDVQAAELRRIERDLHDGAQARLVALSMQLGRAEERLGDRPELAELVRSAREEAGAAVRELRDLARGIAPPVLADRGLVAAVEALGRRAATPVVVEASVDRRLPPVIESAAYFVVAEALTNVGKHASGARAMVRLVLDDDRLTVEVADDGPGGADPRGGGLTGLRHRVEAIDGSLHVVSPPGQGTTIRAELPCGS
ncbi:MAG: sensor histidine kinase [Nocardioidaceae bacterium]